MCARPPAEVGLDLPRTWDMLEHCRSSMDGG
eukprot:CAMPEP_0197914278 /NCGR_PEP_ID=MMETSP1439-20131203/78249_1 /TAXON_ID=66791 /ORGANISM="Gonyaulax spinifera, Strain CCMP409" /LENGTH=30 /DNA_ID= /DNA_START= /DNA_END= /DNA_ORIENTATION=